MDKTLAILLEEIRDNTLRTKMLYRMIRKLRKANGKTACALALIDLYLVVNEIRWNLQKQTNKELRKELEALKQMKGE